MKKTWKQCAGCACSVVTRNPATVRLIGLCPMLAVSNTVLKAVALGLLLSAVVIISASIVSVLRYCVSWRLKPIYHALIGAFVTSVVVAGASIKYHEVVAAMGIYPALIAGNCLVLSFMQETAERNSLVRTLKQGSVDVVGVVVFLGLFGTAREIAAYGAILTDWALVNSIRPPASAPTGPFALIASAPGALLMLALFLAGVNAIVQRYQKSAGNGAGVQVCNATAPSAPDPGSNS